MCSLDKQYTPAGLVMKRPMSEYGVIPTQFEERAMTDNDRTEVKNK